MRVCYFQAKTNKNQTNWGRNFGAGLSRTRTGLVRFGTELDGWGARLGSWGASAAIPSRIQPMRRSWRLKVSARNVDNLCWVHLVAGFIWLVGSFCQSLRREVNPKAGILLRRKQKLNFGNPGRP